MKLRPTPPPQDSDLARVQLTNVVRFSCQGTNLEWPQKSPFTDVTKTNNPSKQVQSINTFGQDQAHLGKLEINSKFLEIIKYIAKFIAKSS